MTEPLIVDVYPGDGSKNWVKLIAAGPPWIGAVFKLSEGLDYEYASWVIHQRSLFLTSPRYGKNLFDGMYHYLTFHQDGGVQAERFWSLTEKVGGERLGTLWGMVDAERGGQRPGLELTKNLVEDRIATFAQRYEKLSGRKATLYGGELLRSIDAHGLYGCGRSSVALYASELHGHGENTAQFLARTGTDPKHLFLWQYAGTAPQTAVPVGYPLEAPGCGRVDISTLTLPGGIEALRAGLWAESPALVA